jgi:hypothetical protein
MVFSITGTNFPVGAGVSITVNGQQLTVKGVTVESSEFITAVIKPASAPPSGSVMKVRITTPSSVHSNEVLVTKP